MNNVTTHFMPQDALHAKAEGIARGIGQDNAGKPSAQFETLFLYKVVEAMRSTVPESGLLTSKSGSEMYDHLVAQALSEAISKGGGIGIAQFFSELDGDSDDDGTTGSVVQNSHISSARTQSISTADTLALSGLDVEGIDTPLADILPPASDPWLEDPEAESTLQQILSGGSHE